MAISTTKLVGITVTLVAALAIASFVLINSIIPQYSVYELFKENDPNKMLGKNVQLIGDVYNISNDRFTIQDWEGENITVIVIHENIPIPSGFEIGKRVLIEGSLEYTSEGWVIKATQISTKCPSKYQS